MSVREISVDPSASPATHGRESAELRIPLAREELTATARPIRGGLVRIAKRVVNEDQEFDVQKQTRSSDEIVVSKEGSRRVERLRDTVRREEVFVDGDAAVIDETASGGSV